jgi:hypothetical protein
MKSFFSIFLIFIISSIALQAQDIITLNNAEEIIAKVDQIGLDEVTYRKYNNLNGPIYKIKKSSIFMIKYENGIKEVFNKPGEITQTKTISPNPSPQLTFSNGKFLLNNNRLNYNDVGNLMAASKNANAYETFSIANEQYKASKPTRVIGLIVGIIGSVVTAQTLMIYTLNNTSSYNNDNTNYIAVATVGSVVGVTGWATFSYGVVLKKKALLGFKKATNEYNSAF